MKTNQSFIINGLAGKKSLKGEISVSGAKNAALKAIAATILFDGPVTLENIPDTNDIHTIVDILKKMGAKIELKRADPERIHEVNSNHGMSLVIDTSAVNSTKLDTKLASSMRASVVLTGPVLARFGEVFFPEPGGCVIGARPIDIFLDSYKLMGAEVSEKDREFDIKCKDGLRGAEIIFRKISVGATETLMMASTLADGKTTLKNCALEPEIVNVAEWLNECGANIKGAGTSIIEIIGTSGKLLKAKKPYITIPDRIEAGSFLLLGALCAEELTIKNCRPDHMGAVIDLLKKAGVAPRSDLGIPRSDLGGLGDIKITGNTKPNSSFKAFNIITKEYPGFPTDLQAPAVVFLTQVTGKSTVTENIFEGRFKYVADLNKMGANIREMSAKEIQIEGPTLLNELPDGEQLGAHDIRAGFAIVMAAIVGKGSFKIDNIHLIDRGYEKLEERLRAIGVEIERV